MAFHKVSEVNAEFYRVFLRDTVKRMVPGDSINQYTMLPIPMDLGWTSDFNVRYYKRSGQSSTEDQMEIYPCIVIQNFTPMIDKAKVRGKNFVLGYVNTETKTRELITLPIPFIYRYQVSVISKLAEEHDSAMQWFATKFSLEEPGFFTFNEICIPDQGSVGDIVRYTCEVNEVPRDDNRFEFAFDFTLYAFVHSKPVQQKEYIEQIAVYLEQKAPTEIEQYLLKIIDIHETV